MLRRQAYNAPDGAYTVQERYGLWLCKDFIPIQRKNEWITTRGSEFTKLHAFLNCQALKLTANRGSVENTPAEILQDVEQVVRRIYQEIIESEEWLQMTYLEEEAESYNTEEKEKKNFELRVNKANKAKVATYKGTVLVEVRPYESLYTPFKRATNQRPTCAPVTVTSSHTSQTAFAMCAIYTSLINVP
jgi:hypothetical protein